MRPILYVSIMSKVLLLFQLLLPEASPKGSHSLWLLATYIKGQTPFPEFSAVVMLDDVIVQNYDGETKTRIPRGNTTTEDDVLDLNVLLTISDHLQAHFLDRWTVATKMLNETDLKPRVRLIQKANSDSGGFRVSCLATGFYPRHINLTLFRDGQPVSDHEITGGDLLPNGDGTYQMRKSLEISADKHKYTCSATHLSLDNKLDVTLEFDPDEPFKSVILPVLIVLALMLVFGAGAIIYKCRRRRAGVTRTEMNGESSMPSSNCDYSPASKSEENMEPAY